MDDDQILDKIHKLVADEHELRRQVADGTLDPATERERLAGLERSLDQAWDLLRQRRARKEMGQPVAEATERSADEVTKYLQ